MHSLPREPQPAVTRAPEHRSAPLAPAAVYYTLALTLTAASTASCSELMNRFTLPPSAVISPKNTNTTSLRQQVAFVAPTSWLETTIDALLASVPDEEWAKVPDIYVADIDSRM